MLFFWLEKVYCDFGIDVDNIDILIEVGFGFVVKLDKLSGFIGCDVLVVFKVVGVFKCCMV